MVDASPADGAVDDCSPLAEFYNGTTDYLFVGVAQNGILTGCNGSATIGCLYNFNITTAFPSNSVAGLAVTGNTSGIVIDNSLGSPGRDFPGLLLAASQPGLRREWECR